MSCYSEDQIVTVVLEIIKLNPGIRTSELIDEVRKIKDIEKFMERNKD